MLDYILVAISGGWSAVGDMIGNELQLTLAVLIIGGTVHVVWWLIKRLLK